MKYTPDNWVVIKLDDGVDPHYRVLAGWSGGYLDGDRWRINSGITKVETVVITGGGITKVEEDDGYYNFSGSSGSTYRCGKKSYMLRMNNAHVWSKLEKLHGDKVEMMPEDTDWVSMDWIIK